jgi:hypothetical protein
MQVARCSGLPDCRLADSLLTPHSGDMTPLRARVQNGQLRLDQPTGLPEGTELDLVIDDEGDDLTEHERQALHETLSKSWSSAEASKLRPAAAIISELRRKG